MLAEEPPGSRFVARWEVADVRGAVVAVDVIRAFTTAAYAFAAGAREIFLVDSVDQALALKRENPRMVAMGEDRGRRPDGFDLSNSPVAVASADLVGRSVVQRTSAGTRGVAAARSAERLWCASLVCASATAAAVRGSGFGAPTYLITGRFEDAPDTSGYDDLVTAQLIERARLGLALNAPATAHAVRSSDEASRTLELGPDHVHPDDIRYATRIDAFDFAMEVHRVEQGLRLTTA